MSGRRSTGAAGFPSAAIRAPLSPGCSPATLWRMDPFSVLEVAPGASSEELTAAYRRAAKRWHPDRGGGAEAQARMAEVNVAYDLLRSGEWQRRRPDRGAAAAAEAGAAPRAHRRPPGHWLSPALRRALGSELLRALEREEDVALVTPAATWASPRTLLAVTDRRLLWLLDDVVTGRVHALRLGAISAVEHRL